MSKKFSYIASGHSLAFVNAEIELLKIISYHIVGKFGKFGKSLMIRQTKTIQISNNLLADLLIRQTLPLPNFPV